MLTDSASKQKTYATHQGVSEPKTYKIENDQKGRKSLSEWFNPKRLCSLDEWKLYVFKKRKFLRFSFYRNNIAFFSTIIVYFLVQIGLALLQLNLYSQANNYVKVARVGGILLNFNSCLVILLVMRRLTTWLRNLEIGRRCLALDEFLNFHKFIGFFILALSLMHTIAHCVNLFYLSSNYLDKLNKNIGSKMVSTFSISSLSNNSNTSDINVKINVNYSYPTNLTSNIPVRAASYVELMFTRKSNIGWIWALAMPTGWALLVILLVIIIFALPCIRKNGYFQLFHYTHWLHVAYFILLFVHCTNFWKWFILPFFLVLIERVYTLVRVKSIKFGETYIKEVNLLSSNVTNLVITRPKNFKFKAGDYVFVNIPDIAKFEWHPFTISSAPEQKDELTLHIRSLGNWTNKLYDYFDNGSRFNTFVKERDANNKNENARYRRKMSNLIVLVDYKAKKTQPINEKTQEEEKQIQINLNIANKIENVWKSISIDGPYGTASRRIFNSEHAVLIAGGIGVTPFASILQSLWFKYMKSLKKCAKCNHEWYDDIDQKKLRKVDFIWVNRDYQSFEWFIELLGQIELQQMNVKATSTKIIDRFIQIHLFMTSAKCEQEIKPIDAQNQTPNENEQKTNEFLLKLKPGRPDFDTLFKEISAENKGKVDVYFCGNSEFGRIVQKKAIQFKYKFSKEYF